MVECETETMTVYQVGLRKDDGIPMETADKGEKILIEGDWLWKRCGQKAT